MNSQTLKESGFSTPTSLDTISFSNMPFEKSLVFALIDSTLTEKTPSDILYIGRTRKPVKRILGGYLGGFGGKTTRRISSRLFNEGYIEKVCISWMESDRPKIAQRELLVKFDQEYGEMPLWNTTRKKQIKAQKAAPKAKPKVVKTKIVAPADKTAKPNKTSKRAPKSVKAAPSTKPAEATSPTQPSASQNNISSTTKTQT